MPILGLSVILCFSLSEKRALDIVNNALIDSMIYLLVDKHVALTRACN